MHGHTAHAQAPAEDQPTVHCPGRVARYLHNGACTSAVEFVSERITVDCHGTCPLDSLMLGILAAFAESERRRIKERQAEGIALAKARGKHVQQPKLDAQDLEQIQALLELGLPKTEVAARLGVTRQTLYAALKRSGPAAVSTGSGGSGGR